MSTKSSIDSLKKPSEIFEMVGECLNAFIDEKKVDRMRAEDLGHDTNLWRRTVANSEIIELEKLRDKFYEAINWNDISEVKE